ncbi:hypothetical protein [Acidisoma sp. C75]
MASGEAPRLWARLAGHRLWAKLPPGPLLPALAIFAIALAARLHGLAAMPFWLDEVTTVRRLRLGFGGMAVDSLHAHHLPAYFWLLALLHGSAFDEASLRLPSAVFGAAAAAILAAIAWRLAGRAAGFAAGLLMALSPIHVQYGQEARSYTLVILMMTVALAGFVELARDPAAAGRPRAAGGRLWPWLAYGCGSAAGLLVLSIAFWWLIAANLAAIPLVRALGAERRLFLRRWLLTQGLVLAATLPWFAAMAWATEGRMGSGTEWVPPLTWHSFTATLGVLYGLAISRLISFHLFPAPLPGLGLGLLCLACLGLRRLRQRLGQGPAAALLPALVILAAAPPLLVLAISLAKPLWMPRYIIWGSVPFFLIVSLGCGLLAAPRRRHGATLALGLVAAVNLLPYYRAETKPRWDLAGAAMAARLKPGDLLLVPDRGPIAMMDFFLARRGQAIPSTAWTRDVFAAARHLDEGGRVWVVAGKVGQADPTTRKAFARITAPLGSPAARMAAGDLISITLYDHAPGGDRLADIGDGQVPRDMVAGDQRDRAGSPRAGPKRL